MSQSIEYKLMKGDLLTTSCLHGGPIEISKLPELNNELGMRFLRECEEKYGASGILAIDRTKIVGILRFYPEEIFDLFDTSLCIHNKLQNEKASVEEGSILPPKEELSGSIRFQCIQVATGYYQAEQDYGNKGIAKHLFDTLISWAKDNSFDIIRSAAINKVPPLMMWSGLYPHTSLESLGFEVKTVRVSESIKEVIENQQQGHHGQDVKQSWSDYKNEPLDQLAQVYDMQLKLKS